MKTIRILDCTFSLVGLCLLFPLFTLIAIAIKLGSKGPVFFKQSRIGKNEVPFYLWKFRTMVVNADSGGLLTIGGRDKRVTRVGYYLRRFKLDELPQLWNVLKGEMSIVGPRPEVKKYVDLYTPEQKKVLSIRPGITDIASITYRNENSLLSEATDPEQHYVNVILPGKLRLNEIYIRDQSVKQYLNIISRTLVTSILADNERR